MNLSDIRTMLLCEVFTGEELLNRPVTFGCASDLMSDVLAFSATGALLLTGLVNVQTVRTAHIAENNAIIFVRGKRPDTKVIAFAQKMGLPLMGTPYSMYEACGILYKAGIESTMKCGQAAAAPDRT